MLSMTAEKPISNDLVASVLDFIEVLSSTVRHLNHSFESSTEVTSHEIIVLSELSANGPMRVKDIITRLVGVSPSTLTRILDRLEQDGLVQRTLNPLDRRSFRISLTERGAEVVDDYTANLEDVVHRMLDPLTPAERMMLAELQSTMTAALDAPTQNLTSEAAD